MSDPCMRPGEGEADDRLVQGGRLCDSLRCHVRRLRHPEAIPQGLWEIPVESESQSQSAGDRLTNARSSQWFKEHVPEGSNPAAETKKAPSSPLKANGAIANGANGKSPAAKVCVSVRFGCYSDQDERAADGHAPQVSTKGAVKPKKSRKAPFARFTAYISTFLGL